MSSGRVRWSTVLQSFGSTHTGINPLILTLETFVSEDMDNSFQITVFRQLCEAWEEQCKEGRHRQVPRHLSLRIDLFGDQYDSWSSCWDRVLSSANAIDRPAPKCTIAYIWGRTEL